MILTILVNLYLWEIHLQERSISVKKWVCWLLFVWPSSSTVMVIRQPAGLLSVIFFKLNIRCISWLIRTSRLSVSSRLTLGGLFDSPTPDRKYAEEAIVLVSGMKKSRALQKVVEEGINHMWTASALQNHPKGTIICDDEATHDLKVGTYRYFLDIEQKNLDHRVNMKIKV